MHFDIHIKPLKDKSEQIERTKVITKDCPYCNSKGERDFAIHGKHMCPVCKGDGFNRFSSPVKKCAICSGTGEKAKPVLGVEPCPQCKGTGWIEI